MMNGFIKIYRSLFTNDIWTKKPFDYAHAWIDLLQMANIKDSVAWLETGTVDVKRGQVFCSMQTLADRWGWSRKKVLGFIRALEGKKMVTTEGTAQGTTLTIENYTFYNGEGTTKGTTEGTTKGQRRDNEGTSNKKERKKERKNIKGDVSSWIADIVPEELQKSFSDWADMRKEIKKPVTTRETVKRAWDKLQTLSRNPEIQKRIVAQSVDQCYMSFFPLKTDDAPKRYKEFEPEQKRESVPMSAEQRRNKEKILQGLNQVL